MYDPQDYICVDQVVDVYQCISVTININNTACKTHKIPELHLRRSSLRYLSIFSIIELSLKQHANFTRLLNTISIDQV